MIRMLDGAGCGGMQRSWKHLEGKEKAGGQLVLQSKTLPLINSQIHVLHK